MIFGKINDIFLCRIIQNYPVLVHNVVIVVGDSLMDKNAYMKLLDKQRAKVIAVVYIFEGDDLQESKYYEVWKGDLIGEWIQAINELNCLPLVFDTRTFVQKAMDRTLPKIDYVVNLNNGAKDVSMLGLVPSVCSFLSIPCIPNNTVSTVVGEHKLLSNLIAYSKNLKIPKELERSAPGGIVRPYSYGSSIGVRKYTPSRNEKEIMYQEFIQGYDATTPLLYNPMTGDLEVLPSILYRPEKNDTNWYLGESEKKAHTGYKKVCINIDDSTKKHYLEFAKSLSIRTYCRIDSRISCDNINEAANICINFDSIYFLEVNPMPTIKNDINFHTSIKYINREDDMYPCYMAYREKVNSNSCTGFILSCSMIALSKAKCEI